ncbi:MAG: ABC transporter permease [Bacteroidales bacterium]
MIRYIIRRMASIIPVIIGITVLIYFVMSFSPGDPATMMLGSAATPEAIDQLRSELGLDKPVLVQYLNYMKSLVKGDMGRSYITNNTVVSEIISRLPVTLKLAVLSIGLAVIIAIPIGIICGVKPNTLMDGLSMIFTLIGVSMPAFWLSLIMILIFSVSLKWLPAGGSDTMKHFILPAVTLSFGSMAIIARTMRSSLLEVIRQDYITTARAKGVPKKMITRKHALNNALIPTVTVIGLEMGTNLGGAVLTETVFAMPGLGRLIVDSIKNQDTPLVLGGLITFAVFFSLVNLGVDILYAFIDPRIKSQYK